jgi:hypothetical protein
VLTSTGYTAIQYLKIGTQVIVGAPGSGALVPAGTIAPNTFVSVPGVGAVVLNKQTPITNGLTVIAADISGSLFGVPTSIQVGFTESDLHGCAAITG